MCPHCQRTYRTRTEAMGQTAVCTKCREPFRIGQALAKFEWKSTDLGEDSWIGVEVPEEKPEPKHCIICGAPLDEGEVSCRECGANQVTGVVHRKKRRGETREETGWSMIPVRPLVIGLIIAALGGGLFWFMHRLGRTAVELVDHGAEDGLVIRARNHLRESADETTFRAEFAGRVTDENIERFARRLYRAADPEIRRTTEWLIGAGRFTDLASLFEPPQGESPIDLRPVFDAIGARRLVALSNHEDEPVRRLAARALMALFRLGDDESVREELAERVSAGEKIARLNRLYRPWPQAVGAFSIVVNEEVAPFEAVVEQIGRTFYLTLGDREFRSLLDEERTFVIPIEYWCAATGTAVDPAAVSMLMSGSVRLESPFGVGWEGVIRVVPQHDVAGSLPGFLPIGPLERGEVVEAHIDLEPP